MKFPLLPMGARFEYEGKVYVKVGPLTAAAEDGGGARMIPRHAVLKAVGVETSLPPPTPQLDRAAVLAAFAAYHASCEGLIEQSCTGIDAPGRAAARAALAEARRRFLDALSN